MELIVQLKQAGKRENKIQTAKLILAKKPNTLEELIRYTVSATFHLYQEKRNKTKRYESGDLSQLVILPEEQIEDASASGKIDFGFLHGRSRVTESEAIETALDAFRDGLVAVFIDKKRQEDLADRLNLSGNETITFVKLTMLAGRMW